MRSGDNESKDAAAVPDERTGILDWLNLPPGTSSISLWESLHDSEIISVCSNLMERSMTLSCEIEHLRSFHQFDIGFQFILQFEGVQSARVLCYSRWPGGCSDLNGLSYEEQNKVVAEYQAKWREESGSWNEFESGFAHGSKQAFDISDAALATSPSGLVAFRICGHLNDAEYHEVFVRFEKLKISGNDGRQFGLEEFQRLGEAYWEAFSRRSRSAK